jgi:hypothetical protein
MIKLSFVFVCFHGDTSLIKKYSRKFSVMKIYLGLFNIKRLNSCIYVIINQQTTSHKAQRLMMNLTSNTESIRIDGFRITKLEIWISTYSKYSLQRISFDDAHPGGDHDNYGTKY